MTNGRKLDHYRYTISPASRSTRPLGRMTTLHLVKQHQPDESGTEIWIAPQHRYLPVKLLVLDERRHALRAVHHEAGSHGPLSHVHAHASPSPPFFRSRCTRW